jgi:hypothetical protein
MKRIALFAAAAMLAAPAVFAQSYGGSSSTTTGTMPSGAESRHDFRRWMSLK